MISHVIGMSDPWQFFFILSSKTLNTIWWMFLTKKKCCCDDVDGTRNSRILNSDRVLEIKKKMTHMILSSVSTLSQSIQYGGIVLSSLVAARTIPCIPRVCVLTKNVNNTLKIRFCFNWHGRGCGADALTRTRNVLNIYALKCLSLLSSAIDNIYLYRECINILLSSTGGHKTVCDIPINPIKSRESIV